MKGFSARQLLTNLRVRLLLVLWLTRFCLVWVFAYPIYGTLADSPQLQGSSGDSRLFSAGADTLLDLLDERADTLTRLSPALWVTGLLALVVGTLCSSAAWTACCGSRPWLSTRIRLQAWSNLPAFCTITAVTIAPVAVVWALLPEVASTVSAAVEIWLGEAGANFVELALVLLLLGALAVLWILADLVRGMVAPGHLRLRPAVKAAAAQYLSTPLRITVHATVRLLPMGLAQPAAAWLAMHEGWLAGGSSDWLLALLCGELGAGLAIWLRLDWIAWVCRNQQLTVVRDRSVSP